MANPLIAEPPPEMPPNSSLHDLSAEFNNLPLPDVDSLFFSLGIDAMPTEAFASDVDLGFGFEENGEFEITFDDLDDLCDDYLIPDGNDPTSGSDHPIEMDAGYNRPAQGSDSKFPSSESHESDDSCGFKRDFLPPIISPDSDNQNSNNSACIGVSRFPSPASGDSRNRESSDGPVSSQGSGNCGSGVYQVLNSPSPDSGRCDKDISSDVAVGRNFNFEQSGNNCVNKRKKLKEHDEGSPDFRTTKYQRSLAPTENSTQQGRPSVTYEEEEKRKARLMRNRESAQLSRQRKKYYIEELQDKVRTLNATVSDLNGKISFFMAENASLKQQLSAAGMCPPPAPGMYPMPPMYPWVPSAPYVMQPQGSRVPLVPIPRLKAQQPTSSLKVKKPENRKTEGKTKKVAGISLLGLFFFMLLFGGLVPLVNVKFGGYGDDVSFVSPYVGGKYHGQQRARVLHVNGFVNGSKEGKGVGCSGGDFDVSGRMRCERGQILREKLEHEQKLDPYESIHQGNASEPLVASLYVPRNDKLVKIDGNLIIHSILASEKAVASQTTSYRKDNKETGLAIHRDQISALAIPEVGKNRGRHSHAYRNPIEQQKALASGSAEALKEHLKSTSTDGKLQQWFREGLAGPMLSSGVCTEVFQFDVSPTHGAIIPASSARNASAETQQNTTALNKGRNRRILHGVPVSLTGNRVNKTEHVGSKTGSSNLSGNKSTSSMIVSVLVDPREAADIEVDGMITSKSLSRIFVVVLLDSVKYVTYSCVLPRPVAYMVTA